MRADARANRDAILAAARRLYADRGAGVSFNTLADEAGVGIATLYRHFPTPLDLKVGLADEVLRQIDEIARPAAQRIADDAPAGWRWFAEQLAALQLAALLPRLAGDLGPDDLPAELVATREAIIARIGDVLALAREAGLVAEDVTPIRFHLGLAWISRPLPAPALAMEPQQQAWLLATYLRGLRP
jgi:AcrR family transcriptional regulator